jgi:predicted transcriptional regulator
MEKYVSDPAQNPRLLALTAEIVAAHVSHNHVAPEGVSALITAVYDTLSGVGSAPAAPEKLQPAVPVQKSVFPDYIICLEDGKKLKMLKRHLQTSYQMTPDQYRERWGLPRDYPMVAPDYAERRSALAKQIGLGTRRRGDPAAEPSAPPPPPAKARVARPAKATKAKLPGRRGPGRKSAEA